MKAAFGSAFFHKYCVTCCVRYCYCSVGIDRHCGSRSAVEMGGDMRGPGSHLGATAAPVSLRQGAAQAGGGKKIIVAKNVRRRQSGARAGQAAAISRCSASLPAWEGDLLTVNTPKILFKPHPVLTSAFQTPVQMTGGRLAWLKR